MLARVEAGEQLPASEKAAWVKLLQVWCLVSLNFFEFL